MSALLSDRRLLVTGAARGIGLAVARAALAHGGRVVLADIDAEAVGEAAGSLGGAAAGAHAVEMDVADQASVEAALEQATTVLGGLDGLVNNAAMLDVSDTAAVTLGRFETVLSVNLTAVLRVSQTALPALARSQAPAIVNTLSTQALFGQPESVAYVSAKSGALGLTRAMAVDLAPQGVRVNAVAPGFIDTRMAIRPDGHHEHHQPAFRQVYLAGRRIPLARPGTPEDCVGAFVFLLSPLSGYVTGQVVVVDGGLTATY